MSRKSSDRAKVDAVSRRLREMFEALERRPVPDRLMSVIDQLDDGEDQAPVAPDLGKRQATAG